MIEEIKQLAIERHRCSNKYNLTQSAESFGSLKKISKLVGQKLKVAQNQFLENFLKDFQISIEKRNFI